MLSYVLYQKDTFWQYFAVSSFPIFRPSSFRLTNSPCDKTLHHPSDGSANDTALPIVPLLASKFTVTSIDTQTNASFIRSLGELPLDRLYQYFIIGRRTPLLPPWWHSTPVGATNPHMHCLRRIQRWYWPMSCPWWRYCGSRGQLHRQWSMFCLRLMVHR